jgi:hypothetical protein
MAAHFLCFSTALLTKKLDRNHYIAAALRIICFDLLQSDDRGCKKRVEYVHQQFRLALSQPSDQVVSRCINCYRVNTNSLRTTFLDEFPSVARVFEKLR